MLPQTLTEVARPNLPIRASGPRAQDGGKFTRSDHRKSRTGCRTCRVRRVKCDEAKPICRRCQKADVTCDGYDPVFIVSKQTRKRPNAPVVDTAQSGRPIIPKGKVVFDIPRSPPQPAIFAVPEYLFSNIEYYMKVSFSSQTWTAFNGELCHKATIDTKQLDDEDLDRFFNYCTISIELFRKQQFVEFRRALSQACGMVQNIIKAEHPKTLEHLLHVFLLFILGNMPEVLALLRKYISSVARLCLIPAHPWAQILELIGSLDPLRFEETALQCWVCMTGMYKQVLGDRHPTSLCSEITMLNLNLDRDHQNLHSSEKRLRSIRLRCTVGSRASFQVLNSLWRNLIAQSKNAEAESIISEYLRTPKELKRMEYHVLGIFYLARVQYDQGKLNSAKQNFFEAARILETESEPSDPWALRALIMLQSLWQKWAFEPEEITDLVKDIQLRMQHGKIDEDDF